MVILVTLLPLLLTGVIASLFIATNQRAAFENGARNATRTLLAAVEADLRATIAPLELLALSSTFDGGNLKDFRSEAERALRERSEDWTNVLVSDPESDAILFDLLVPEGQALPRAPGAFDHH